MGLIMQVFHFHRTCAQSSLIPDHLKLTFNHHNQNKFSSCKKKMTIILIGQKSGTAMAGPMCCSYYIPDNPVKICCQVH